MAKHGEATDLLEVWADVIADPPADQDFYNQLVRARATTYDPTAMLDLFQQLVRALEERGDWQNILRVVTAAAPLWPDNDVFRQAVLLALQDKYGDHPNAQQMLDATRLEQGAPIDQGLKRFRALLRLSPGRAYQHATWGVGVVKELNLDTGKVTLDFPAEQGRVLTLAGVRDFLKYLPPTHFLARRATEPESLNAFGEEDPAGLVRLILESFKGRIKQGEMKTLLLDGVLTESRWNNWWTRAREAMKMDPLIDFDKGGAHSEIVLRSKPKSFEEEVQDLFFHPESSLTERIAAVRKLQSTVATSKPDPEMLTRMVRSLGDDYRKKQGSAGVTERLQIAYLARDLRQMGDVSAQEGAAIPSPEVALAELDGDYSPLANLESEDHAAEALRTLMERDGEQGYELAAGLFPRASSKLAQVIWRSLDLEQHKDIALHAVQAVLAKPLSNPQTYLWVLKQLGDENWPTLKEYFPMEQLVPELLDHVDAWDKMQDHPSVDRASQATAKLLISRVKSQLENKAFAMMCRAVEQMDLDSARRFRRSLQAHTALPEAYKYGAERQVVLSRRELEEEQAAPSAGATSAAQPAAEGEGLHYTTPRAREMKFRELEELNSVKIPENSREIEKARSEGDLKENAGYIYAKEQQKLLMQQTLQLQQQLQTARLFDPSKVNTGIVSFGVTFEAENLKKTRRETYTVLGQFETDPDRNIISYQSPFMQQFMGKKVGDEVVIRHPDGSQTPYKIASISDALAGGEWDAPGVE
jgi:transcription elongation factor GreA